MSFLKNLFSSDKKDGASSSGSKAVYSNPADEKSFNLLVLDGGKSAHNWYLEFAGCKLADGTPIRVEQSTWRQLTVSVYSHTSKPVCVTLQPSPNPLPSTPQNTRRTFFPQFLLVRNEVRGIDADNDRRNALYAFMYAGLPAVNSLSSILFFQERPLVHGELLKISKRVGNDAFPVIPQAYHGDWSDMMYTRDFPAVVKMGHAHAGYGKMKINTAGDFSDFRGLLAMTGQYCTSEPYWEGAYDLRIQKIGDTYRAFKRVSVSGNWKTNVGSSKLEEIAMTPAYKRWADEAATMLGGLDILTVDAIHSIQHKKDFILEVNGTSSGLYGPVAAIDNRAIRTLTIQRMSEYVASEKKEAAALAVALAADAKTAAPAAAAATTALATSAATPTTAATASAGATPAAVAATVSAVPTAASPVASEADSKAATASAAASGAAAASDVNSWSTVQVVEWAKTLSLGAGSTDIIESLSRDAVNGSELLSSIDDGWCASATANGLTRTRFMKSCAELRANPNATAAASANK